MRKPKKIVFISSRQKELQDQRDQLRNLINEGDELLPKIFKAYTFEMDLAGRRESVSEIVKDLVLKSDVYLGVFDREFSEPTAEEYRIAVDDKFVPKEMIIFIRGRKSDEREDALTNFLSDVMHPEKGHACVIYSGLDDLLSKAKHLLLDYYGRSIESFVLSEETLGPKLDGARGTNMPESVRRQLLEPMGRYLVPRGRKGFPEYYKLDLNGNKIDITWEFIMHESRAPEEVVEFYRKRYKKLYD
ncbi:MAG: DUF4062 domain-containing protein [Deltaproteobacteria bacterium]|nr:DUF4062 domain-containing protein [Deltaproteobacteria bacterium]